MNTRAKPSIWIRLAVSALLLLLFLAIVETALRIVNVDTFVQNRFFVLNRALDYPDVFMKDQQLFWRLRPGQEITSQFFQDKTYRINSLGLRGDEVAAEKSAPRIITLGNSCTFGWGVKDSFTFQHLLERKLGGQCEIINAGIPGYTSFQGKKFLKTDLLNLQPDILLVMFAWNDHWAAASQIADKDQEFPPETVICLQNFFARLHSYRLLKKAWLSTIEPSTDSLFDRGNPVYRVGFEDFQANLTEICRIARQSGATSILMTSPVPSLELYYPLGVKAPMHAFHRKYNDITRQVAIAESVPLVDLEAEFDKQDGLWNDAEMDPIHFNAEGHRLAAELIANAIDNL